MTAIGRAVTNKTVSELLDERFKRQLKLDGLDTKVSIICTKTDDIDFKEIYEDLRPPEANEIEQALRPLRKEQEELEHRKAALKS